MLFIEFSNVHRYAIFLRVRIIDCVVRIVTFFELIEIFVLF